MIITRNKKTGGKKISGKTHNNAIKNDDCVRRYSYKVCYEWKKKEKNEYVYQIFYKNEWKIKIRKGWLVSDIFAILLLLVVVVVLICVSIQNVAKKEIEKKPQISLAKKVIIFIRVSWFGFVSALQLIELI